MTVIALANPAIYTNNVSNPTDGELLRADLNTVVNEVNAKETRLTTAEANIAATQAEDANLLHISTTANKAGTVTTTAGSGAVVGVGTTFLVGDIGKILVTSGGQARKITGFTDTTHVTCDTFAATESGVTFYYAEQINSAKQSLSYIIPPALSPTYAMFNKRNRVGPLPTWTSGTTITVPSGITVIDSTGMAAITTTTSLVISTAASGALGIDTGVIGASKFYYTYLIMKLDGTVSALISLVDESTTGTITLPAGYWFKHQLTTTIYSNSVSSLLQFFHSDWTSWVEFMVNVTDFSGPTAGTTNELAGGTADGSAHTVALVFCPTNADTVKLLCRGLYVSAARSITIIPTGSGLTVGQQLQTNAANIYPERVIQLKLNSSKQIDYKISGANSSLYVDTLAFIPKN